MFEDKDEEQLVAMLREPHSLDEDGICIPCSADEEIKNRTIGKRKDGAT